MTKATALPGSIDLPMKDPPRAAITVWDQILDPHVLFSSMYHEHPASFKDRLCGNDFNNISNFWSEMAASGHPAFLHHNMKSTHAATYMTCGIPITIHGDGAPISGLGKSWLKLAEIHSWSSCHSLRKRAMTASQLWSAAFGQYAVLLCMLCHS